MQREVNELRQEVAGLRYAIQRISDCPHRSDCPVLDQLQRQPPTITLQQNDQGDTLKLVQVTDGTRASRSEGYRDREEKIVVKTDTVYIEKRDSVVVSNVSDKPLNDKQTGLVPTLKWVFGILCALIVLIITIKVCLRKAL